MFFSDLILYLSITKLTESIFKWNIFNLAAGLSGIVVYTDNVFFFPKQQNIVSYLRSCYLPTLQQASSGLSVVCLWLFFYKNCGHLSRSGDVLFRCVTLDVSSVGHTSQRMTLKYTIYLLECCCWDNVDLHCPGTMTTGDTRGTLWSRSLHCWSRWAVDDGRQNDMMHFASVCQSIGNACCFYFNGTVQWCWHTLYFPYRVYITCSKFSLKWIKTQSKTLFLVLGHIW